MSGGGVFIQGRIGKWEAETRDRAAHSPLRCTGTESRISWERLVDSVGFGMDANDQGMSIIDTFSQGCEFDFTYPPKRTSKAEASLEIHFNEKKRDSTP
jgi:hypothetical protein